jgi:CIC family chloride channel protein
MRVGRVVPSLRQRLVERRGDEPVLLGLAVAVGVVTGVLAVVLIRLIFAVQALAFGALPPVPTLLVVPALGGLLVGLATTYWLPEVAGGGVTSVMTSIALHGGRMRPWVAPGKLVASAVNIGTGASGGREGPIVQIGASVASSVGRVFALDEDRMRTLIAAGAAAGIAASFNAPLAGTFFALEILIGGFRLRSLQTVVVACVAASVTARELLGAAITYQLPRPPGFRDVREIPFYVLLGLAAVVVGVAFIRLEHVVADFAERVRVWRPLRPALGALAVGVIALAFPLVLGTGDHLPRSVTSLTEPIEVLLQGGLGGGWRAVGFLLALVAAKLAATALSIGTGNSVGSFAPAVFLGAALGGGFGHATSALLGASPVEPGAFALVGVAAVLGAAVRAPLTGILLAFELTNDYQMVLPLMLATGIATFAAERLERDSLYTLPLTRRGIVYAEPVDLDLMQTVRVGEVMTREPDSVPADLPLPALLDEFSRTRHHGFPVVDGERLVGVVTLADLATPDRAALNGAEPTAAQLCTRRVVTVTPEDPVFRALRRMAAIDVGRLPVVAADDHTRLVGLVRRADLVKAYQRAVTRSLGAQQRAVHSRLRDLGGVTLIELRVDEAAPAAGCAVRDVEWPARTVLTSIRRHGDVVMPGGDTVLEPGDEVVVLTDTGAAEGVQRLLGS